MSQYLRAFARFMLFSFLSLFAMSAGASSPAVDKGLAWVSSQIQADGSLALPPGAIATPFQTQSEVDQSLTMLATTPVQLAEAIVAATEDNTEYLSRRIVTLAAMGRSVSAPMAALTAIRNKDGGYGGAQGYVSNPLDTAWALVAMQAGGQGGAAAPVLAYLSTVQQADGAFLMNGQADVYVTASVVTALRLYAKDWPVSPAISLATTYLVAQQTAPGNWRNSAWLSAFVYQAIHDFLPSPSITPAVTSYLLGSQLADGSWGGDAYATAIVLRALKLSGDAPSNPALATIKGQLIDSQTWQPVSGATVTLHGSINATAVTGPDGTFEFTGLPPGPYTVGTTLANYGALNTSTTVSASQVLDFGILRVSKSNGIATGTVYGTVTDAVSGAKLAGATVTIGSVTVQTSPKGIYQVLNVPTGDVALRVAQAGYATINATGQVSAGATLLFSPSLAADGGGAAMTTNVSGIVLDAATSLPLAGVTVSVTDGAGVRQLTSGADGKFAAANLVKDAKGGAAILFTLDKYTSNNTYAVLTGVPSLDLGQIRLRKAGGGELLADIAVIGVSRVGALTDPQSLNVTGQAGVTVQNVGAADVAAGVTLLAFQDINRNGKFDAGSDIVLGKISLGAELAVNQSRLVQIPLQGKLTFRDAPIHVWADSDQVVVERSKANNIGSTTKSIEIRPDPKLFSPVVKWHWNGGQVIATPMVGPLTDTNGDGKFDSNDVPTVIVVSALGIDFAPGMITAVSGKDGSQLWQVTDPALYTGSETHPAIADLDGSGKPQVISILHSGGVAVFNHDGSVKCTSSVPLRTGAYDYAGVTVADLDGDGKGEIIVRNTILNSDCSLRAVLGPEPYNTIYVSNFADLEGTGKLNIITPNAVYHNDGSLYFKLPYSSHTAVARLDPNDPHPQLVTVSEGGLTVFRSDGRVMWGPVYLQAFYSGAPTIADFDGSGVPSIGIATYASYQVWGADGSLKWRSPVTDSSSVTGSTAFDFDGSGNAKIVYFDETWLRVIDGKTGAVAFMTENRSATASEYPVVVDVDGDGHADILVPSNSGGSGLRAFQDQNNAWVNTRKIWNEYSYHITNVNDDGSLPKVEQNSWDVHNTYRLNARPGVSATAVPDVTASFVRVDDHGGTSPSTITVRIGNASGLTLDAGVKIAFYNGAAGTTLIGQALGSRALASGEYEDVTLSYAGSLGGIATLTIVADDDGTGKTSITDFDRSNNVVSLPLSGLPAPMGLSVATDSASYASGSDVQISAQIANTGSFDGDARVQFQILTMGGQAVATLPITAVQLQSNGQVIAIGTWNSGTTLAGAYQVKAQLLDANGAPSGVATAGFAVTSGSTSVAAAMTTDKPSYLPTDIVQLTTRVTNLNANVLLNNLKVETSITNPDATVRLAKTESIAQLAQGASKSYDYSSQLVSAPAGTYGVTVRVLASDGSVLTQSATSFMVTSSAQNGAGLTGTITALPAIVPQGESIAFAFSATNAGNSALAGLPLTVRIVDPVGAKVIAEFPYTQTLAVGASYNAALNWKAAGTVGSKYVAILVGTVGGKALTLAQANFSVIAPLSVPVNLDVAQSVYRGSRVLVLVSCDVDSCDEHRNSAPVCAVKNTIAEMLTALHVPYLITTDELSFKLALRSGQYNTYWLSGKQDKLHDNVAAEVREAVYGGDALILDGVHDERNKVLDAVAAITYRGKVGETNLPVVISGPDFTAQRLNTSGRALKIVLAGSKLQASFAGWNPTAHGPALASYAYGNGRGVLFAFDLVGSYEDENKWNPVLGSALTLAMPVNPELIPGALLQTKTSVVNRAALVDVQVRTSYGAGTQVRESLPLGTIDVPGNAISWAFPLAQDASKDLLLALRVPLIAGESTVKTVISTVRSGKVDPYGNPFSVPIKIVGAVTRSNSMIVSLNALSLTGNNRRARDAIVANIQSAMLAFNKNTGTGYEQAIASLTLAGQQMSELSVVDTRAAHLGVTQLLKEAEWRWMLVTKAAQ